MKKPELVFLPGPAPGHLVSTVEFCKRLIASDARLSITILVINSPLTRGSSINQTAPNGSSQDDTSRPDFSGRLSYVDLPQVELPPLELFKESIEHCASVYIASHGRHVRDAITRLQNSPTNPVHVAGLVVDMFSTSMIDIANELEIPSYVFFCSSLGFLGLILHLPAHHDRVGVARFDESDPDTTIPCFQYPVPTRALPAFAFNKLGHTAFMDHAKKFRETKGIIVNSYAELETYALKSLSEEYQTAPVYTVGPVLDLNGQVHRPCDAGERDRIMGWLNKQPESSVVFLCFGSGGSFGEDQVREIAKGLCLSGQRFLWSLRKPPTGYTFNPAEYTEMELKGVLPDEFWHMLEEERGLVCGWTPQVEILGHKATGAFMSHCGWNSTLESLWFGKPIVTWPLYAEQQLNAFELARELGVAVEMTLDYMLGTSNLVSANEVERAISSAMDEDNPVRSRVKEMAEFSRGALMDGGSSFSNIARLIKDMIGEAED